MNGNTGTTIHIDGTTKVVPERRLYSVPDLAILLNLSERKVWRLIGDGTIESRYSEGSRRIPDWALEEYLKNLPTERAA